MKGVQTVDVDDEVAESAARNVLFEMGGGIIALFGVMWFIPITIALIIGAFLKKSSYIEKGPTGELAKQKKLEHLLHN